MQISSQFCRSQEAEQNQRAADSQLDNVKTIALGAAAAWRMEAIAAERREHRRTRIAADGAPPELDGEDGEGDERPSADPDFDETS